MDRMVTTVCWGYSGYAAKLVEDRTFHTDKTSERHVARIHEGLHTLVSFAVEDGGRLGAHAHTFLRTLVRVGGAALQYEILAGTSCVAMELL